MGILLVSDSILIAFVSVLISSSDFFFPLPFYYFNLFTLLPSSLPVLPITPVVSLLTTFNRRVGVVSKHKDGRGYG
jgi:hypothetical protein